MTNMIYRTTKQNKAINKANIVVPYVLK